MNLPYSLIYINSTSSLSPLCDFRNLFTPLQKEITFQFFSRLGLLYRGMETITIGKANILPYQSFKIESREIKTSLVARTEPWRLIGFESTKQVKKHECINLSESMHHSVERANFLFQPHSPFIHHRDTRNQILPELNYILVPSKDSWYIDSQQNDNHAVNFRKCNIQSIEKPTKQMQVSSCQLSLSAPVRRYLIKQPTKCYSLISAKRHVWRDN